MNKQNPVIILLFNMIKNNYNSNIYEIVFYNFYFYAEIHM